MARIVIDMHDKTKQKIDEMRTKQKGQKTYKNLIFKALKRKDEE